MEMMLQTQNLCKYFKKQKSLDAEQYALKEILIFMEKADLNGKRVWHPLSWIAGRRGCIFLLIMIFN